MTNIFLLVPQNWSQKLYLIAIGEVKETEMLTTHKFFRHMKV